MSRLSLSLNDNETTIVVLLPLNDNTQHPKIAYANSKGMNRQKFLTRNAILADHCARARCIAGLNPMLITTKIVSHVQCTRSLTRNRFAPLYIACAALPVRTRSHIGAARRTGDNTANRRNIAYPATVDLISQPTIQFK